MNLKSKIKEAAKSILAILLFIGVGVGITKHHFTKKLAIEKALKIEAQTAFTLAAARVKYLEGENGRIISRNKTLVASVETIKALPDAEEIKKLTGKIDRLQALVNTKFTAKNNFTTPLRDTVIKHDTVYKPARTFTFNDNFLNLNCVVGDSANCGYSYTDSVTSVTHRQRRYPRWQFWRGKKDEYTDFYFKNPNAKAVYIRSVLVKD